MSMELTQQVAAHYGKLPHLRNVVPVKVTFVWKQKEVSFFGVRYTEVNHYTADMQACRDGRANAGDEYTNERFFLVGERPKWMRERIGRGYASTQKHIFTMPSSEHEWFVAGHIDNAAITAEFKQYHPFGANFILGAWSVPGKIDDHLGGRCVRMPMKVEELV